HGDAHEECLGDIIVIIRGCLCVNNRGPRPAALAGRGGCRAMEPVAGPPEAPVAGRPKRGRPFGALSRPKAMRVAEKEAAEAARAARAAGPSTVSARDTHGRYCKREQQEQGHHQQDGHQDCLMMQPWQPPPRTPLSTPELTISKVPVRD
ncbi:unnamed protein product, partial [Prorocentrum cordatum]